MEGIRRYQLPIAVGVAVVVVVAVVAAVVGLGSAGAGATPTPSRPASLAPTPSPADPLSTPEGATRAFFHAFADARKTDDPKLIEPYVTSTKSGAYLSVAGFLGGELAVHRASVLTVQRLDNMTSQVSGDTATVVFDYTEGGYNINSDTGKPTETPNVLPPYHVTATLKKVDGRWLMDSYESRQ